MKVHRRRTRAPFVLTILAVLTVLVFVFLAAGPPFVRWLEARRWAELERSVDELERQDDHRERRRVLLRGTPVPGNAWDIYGPLIQSLADQKSFASTVDFALRGVADGKEDVRAVIAENPVVSGELRRAAAMSELRIPKEFWKDHQVWSRAGIPIAVAVAQAAFLQEEGRGREAADLLLDAAQFALDLFRSGNGIGRYYGWYWSRGILERLAAFADRRLLPDEELDDLVRVLETLDRVASAPTEDLSELVEGGRALLKAGTVEAYFRPMEIHDYDPSLFWYGGSDRLALVDCFGLWMQAGQEGVACEALPWPEARERLIRLQRLHLKSRNPIIRATAAIQEKLSAGDWPNSSTRQFQARIRLVRAALVYRGTGKIPPLDDPFGKTLRWQESARELRIWSVGPNGIDDGGVGSWFTLATKEDIVLRVPASK